MTKRERALLTPAALLRRAWWALAAIPLGFLAAMAVGEGVMSAMGYRPGFDNPPLVQDLTIALVALVVFLVAPVLALWWGIRAYRRGRRIAVVPVGVAAVVGLAMTVLSLVTAFQ